METTEKKETLLYNAYLLAGVIGFAAAVILGLVSLPSVAKSLSWQEFRFIQVKTVCQCLCLKIGMGLDHDRLNGLIQFVKYLKITVMKFETT